MPNLADRIDETLLRDPETNLYGTVVSGRDRGFPCVMHGAYNNSQILYTTLQRHSSAWDDEFESGTADLVQRGWTVRNLMTGNIMTWAGELGTNAPFGPDRYRASIIDSCLCVYTQPEPITLMYLYKPLANSRVAAKIGFNNLDSGNAPLRGGASCGVVAVTQVDLDAVTQWPWNQNGLGYGGLKYVNNTWQLVLYDKRNNGFVNVDAGTPVDRLYTGDTFMKHDSNGLLVFDSVRGRFVDTLISSQNNASNAQIQSGVILSAGVDAATGYAIVPVCMIDWIRAQLV